MEKGIYVSERVIKMIEMGGKAEAIFDCINIDVSTALECANDIPSDDLKYKFLGRRYLDLVEELRRLGIVDAKEDTNETKN